MTLTIFFSSPGIYVIDDDGIRGNGASAVHDSSGNLLFPFTHPTDTISFIAEVPGITFIFNTTDTFGTADVIVGSLTDAAQSPDAIVLRQLRTGGSATLVSNGTITEGGIDSAADIVAAVLTLSAVTGIGTAANALDTQTTFIEAETGTGGISIANVGSVQIGGITADVAGLNVVTSGDLRFSTVGSIYLSDTTGTSSVHGGDLSGSVALIATGADADIYAPIDTPAIHAAGGGITVNAGRDVLMGIGGSNYNNDILATGDITIVAGHDFQLDGTSNVRTGAFGGVVGGDVVISTGHNINLTNTTGGLQTIEAFAGNITLTTGPGGTYFQNAAFSSAVQTTNDIILNADSVLLLAGGLNTTGVGSITVRPVTAGRAIDIGTTLDPADTLGLSDAEFDRLFTLNVNIGGSETGPIEFTAPITPFIVDNLVVRSGTEIFVNSTITLSRSLTLHAGNDLFFSFAAGFTSTLGGFNGFVDDAQDDGGDGGTGDLDGAINVVTGIRLTGNLDNDTLTGTSQGDIINGLAGDDRMNGFDGNDVLDGGAGADLMAGGLGDDTYFADSALDEVIEAAGGVAGRDRVLASVSYTLDANVEDLTLQTVAGAASGTGNAENNTITGNASANTLNGLGGADTLNGNGGNDIMQGGAGDDRYIVDSAGDQAVETSAADGVDLVTSSVSFTLGANVENLSLTGAAAINATGNTLANSLTGNAAANTLNGLGGADIMRGGDGNDGYVVDNAGDQVIESSAAGGTDTVQSSVTFTLGANVENLTLTGAGAINAAGNTLANILTGNGAANILNGLAGADTMSGANGNDTYIVDIAGDQAIETSAVGGTDLVQSSVAFTLGANVENLTLTGAAAINGTGNTLANTINGNSGNNVLDGKAGADSMRGGDGDDNYIVDNVGDQAIESSAAGGSDRVQSSVSFTLGSNVEDLKIIGAGAVNGTGNALANTLVGNAAANQLNGLTGNDTLQGGGGADDFLFTTALGTTNIDRILDMQVGVDDILLENAVFAALAPGALPASAFRTGTAAADADDRIIYDPATGALFYDADGTGGGAAIRFATLQTGLALTAGDFEVI